MDQFGLADLLVCNGSILLQHAHLKRFASNECECAERPLLFACAPEHVPARKQMRRVVGWRSGTALTG